MAHRAVVDGKCQVVYMIPEGLFANPLWWKMPVYQSNLVAVVVDEAHCVQKR